MPWWQAHHFNQGYGAGHWVLAHVGEEWKDAAEVTTKWSLKGGSNLSMYTSVGECRSIVKENMDRCLAEKWENEKEDHHYISSCKHDWMGNNLIPFKLRCWSCSTDLLLGEYHGVLSWATVFKTVRMTNKMMTSFQSSQTKGYGGGGG